MTSNEEINKVLNDAMKEKYKEGVAFGYREALNDFIEAIRKTKLTPDEIYKKLMI